MSVVDHARSDPVPARAVVAAAVIANVAGSIDAVLAALDRQVYGPASVTVIGAAPSRPAPTEPARAADLPSFVSGLPAAITHVWVLHADSLPRPDALQALLVEATRLGARVAGCKVLRADRPEMLESVGMATDVFEVPYSGLDVGEVDQEQYDVVRDVAFVAGVSMLVERSLLADVGLDPLLSPEPAAIDFCQRARLSGARVVVVPSAEVLHTSACRSGERRWRSDAGRLRSALKSYGPVTLIWVVPFAFLLGLAEAVVAPFVGRWRLFDFVRAWAWNLVMLPSAVAARRRLEKVVGDEELFRYQTRGSVLLRRFTEASAAAVRRRASSDLAREMVHWVETGQETVRRPAVAAALTALAFVAVAVRSIVLDGLPRVGFSLPFPDSATASLRSYAGGWNVAGLGSPIPSRPALAFSALVQLLTAGRGAAAGTLLTVAAMVAAVVGLSRLLGGWGIGPVARYLAGAVLIAGPAAAALAGAGSWPSLIALATVPWALNFAIHGGRGRWGNRVGQLAATAALTGIGAAYLPQVLVVPAVLAALWVLMSPGRTWAPALVAPVAALLGLPLLIPWLTAGEVGGLLTEGSPAFWQPSSWSVVWFGLALGAVLIAGDRPLVVVAGWGGAAAALGTLVARSGWFGWGAETGQAGLVTAAIGVAAVAAAALEGATRLADRDVWRRAVIITGTGAAGLLLAGAVVGAAPGRLGLPADQLGEQLRFARTLGEDDPPVRALILGPESTMPGTSRVLVGDTRYRVVSVPEPRSWELWMSAPRLGDQQLATLLAQVRSGETFRAGAALAEFGIKWIVLTEADPILAGALQTQLDLRSLGVAEGAVYEVESEASRARAADGTDWMWNPPDYRGPAGPAQVRLAENADQRWGPGSWSQDGWANLVGADAGLVRFEGSSRLRLQAWAAGGYLVVLLALTALRPGGRRRSARTSGVAEP